MTALCKLSAEMVGMQAGPDLVLSPTAGYGPEGEDAGGPAPTLVLQTKSDELVGFI